MERRIGFAVLLLAGSTALSNEVVYECGKSSSSGFNGWSVSPYSAFSEVEFREETVAFHVENGGEYTLILTRKIQTMKSFSKLSFDIRFDEIENCILNFVDVYASADGKNWQSIETDQDNLTGLIENETGFEYVRIAANVSFYKNGYIECSYFRLEGEDPVSMIAAGEEPETERNEFFVFCFNKSINVETQNEAPYEVIFTNLAGQIMYRESAVGSTRIESGLPEGIYLVSVIQHGQILQTKKVVF